MTLLDVWPLSLMEGTRCVDCLRLCAKATSVAHGQRQITENVWTMQHPLGSNNLTFIVMQKGGGIKFEVQHLGG